MTVEVVASDYQAQQIRIAAITSNQILGLWGRVTGADISASWGSVAPAAAVVLARGQVQAAALADGYLDSVSAAFGGASFANGPVYAAGFGGAASDGRNLSGMLEAAVVASKNAISAGASVQSALQSGGAVMRVMATSQVADAGRTAVSVAMFTRDEPAPASAQPFKGPGGRMYVRDGNGRTVPHFRAQSYVRFVNAGACSRCIILAGKRYEKQSPFLRHPHCHCTHIPIDENLDDYPATDPNAYYEGLSEAEKIKALGKAGVKAIDAGADMNQVVNARQGIYQTDDGRLATRMGTTKRGLYGSSQTEFTKTGAKSKYGRTVQARLMPEEIFKIAPTREDALRLLRHYRYII
ncbi:hypothetical protein [Pseudarthrobacter sp. S6]|uniref:hypothetical protein n=1 Tax=Pseudarthrobacter sp. S6 TaxID=3418420 RepID=UPI003CF32617